VGDNNIQLANMVKVVLTHPKLYYPDHSFTLVRQNKKLP
jgi:hypothetical protein